MLAALLLLLAQSEGQVPSQVPAAAPPPMIPAAPPSAAPPNAAPPNSAPPKVVIVRRVPRGGNPPPPPPPPPPKPGDPNYKPPTWGTNPGVLPPANPGTPVPPVVPTTPTTEPEKPATLSGPVLVRVFSETIVTGESAAPKAILDDKKRDAIETALGNAAGVKGAVYKPELQAYEIQYCGPYEGLDGVKNAFVTTGTPSEMISPLEIVFRPNRTPIQELDKLKKALKQIPGVAEVVQSGNLFRCFATLDNDPRDIAKTAAAAGYEGEVLSHEVVSFKLSGAGKHEEAGSELASCKYVVRVFIDEDEATCLCVKGRVTRALLKSVLQKCGFKVR